MGGAKAEKPVGVLQMTNKIGGGAFDSADEERLAAFSKKAAAVISANPMYALPSQSIARPHAS